MTITVTMLEGLDFGDHGKAITKKVILSSQVELDSLISFQQWFDAEDEILKIEYDCK